MSFWIFGTIPEAAGGSSGAKGCLIPVKNSGRSKLSEVRPRMEAILNSGVQKMIWIVLNPTLYEFGHCLVIRRLEDNFSLSDPLLPAQTVLKIPSREELVLLMSSSTTILGQ